MTTAKTWRTRAVRLVTASGTALGVLTGIVLLSSTPAGASDGSATTGLGPMHDSPTAALQPPGVGLSVAVSPFVANTGQTDETVAFYARTPHGSVFVTETGQLIYALVPAGLSDEPSALALREVLTGVHSLSPRGAGTSDVSVSQVVEGDDTRWARGVTAYDSVELGEVCEGIRAILRAGDDGVEKVFVVGPGGDPRHIGVMVEGATGMAVDAEGRLVISTALGDVLFTKPLAYQEIAGQRVEIEATYEVAGNTYGFTVGEYDRGSELVIDPLLASSFLGGSDAEGGYCANAVALGPDGTVYVTGLTASTDFPTTIGEPYHGGAGDVYVSRFDRTLTDLLASIYLGGGSEEQASCIAVDAAGNVYVSGGTLSSDFPTTVGAYDRTYAGGAGGPYDVPGDVFISKLSADLSTLIASTYFGGMACDYSRAIVVDGTTVYITGATASSGLATAGAFDETRTSGGDWGGIDAYVAEFDTSLSTLLSATYLGGGGSDYCEDMVLTSGGVYVTGWTSSANYPFTPTAFDTTFGGGVYDAFVTGLDASLASLVGSTYLGGTSWDFGYAMCADASGNVYVTGHNAESGAATTFPTTPGSFQEEYNGIGGAGVGDDAFVSKFDGTLSALLASTEFGGTGWEYGTGLKWDPEGYVCIIGTTSSEDIPRHAEAYQYDYAGDDASGNSGEGFVSRLSDNLMYLDTSTYLGGSGNDSPECLVLDGDGNAYVTGHTTSSDFPTMRGSYEEGWQGGDSDAFVSVLSNDLGAIGMTVDPQIGLPPLPVSLSGSAPADPSPDEWAWDIDDDGSADTTGQSAVWTYDTPGTYSIRLEVSYGAFTPSFVQEDAVLVLDESSALRFEGGEDRAVCAAATAPNLKGDLTIEAWINPYDWGGFPFAQMGFGQVVNKTAVSLQLVGVHAQYNDNCLCLSLQHADGTASVSFTPDGSLALDAWQHVAATYDTTTSTVRMWIGGVEQTVSHTVAPSGGIADNASDDLLIGNVSTHNKGFEGAIDEVRVWSLAREPEDVEAGLDYPLFGDEPGLAAYWRMNEAGGDTLHDGSGAGNDAESVGASWVQGVVLHATGVSEHHGEEVAAAMLSPNRPNPFGPGTTLSFTLPEAGHVELTVYDAAGRLVRTLVRENRTAGPHSVVWDGRTNGGGNAASGVYFCRLSAGGRGQSVKMVLVR